MAIFTCAIGKYHVRMLTIHLLHEITFAAIELSEGRFLQRVPVDAQAKELIVD